MLLLPKLPLVAGEPQQEHILLEEHQLLTRAALFGLRMSLAVENILSTTAEQGGGEGDDVHDEQLIRISITVLAFNLHTLDNSTAEEECSRLTTFHYESQQATDVI